MPDDQGHFVDFLSKTSYGTAVEPVEMIQTLLSLVFLAGDRTYKLKRAIKFPTSTSLSWSSAGTLQGFASAQRPHARHLNFTPRSGR